MAYAWIIPIAIVAILGVSGYLVYRYVIFDILANNTINNTLKKYNIKKTQFEIIKEFNENKGETLSDAEINRLAKRYRREEPDQFLSMYDNLRDRPRIATTAIGIIQAYAMELRFCWNLYKWCSTFTNN